MMCPSVLLSTVLAAAAAEPSAPAAAAEAVSSSASIGFWEGAFLGLVQGITEFLPVSSSGHLALGHALFHGGEAAGKALEDARIAFDVTVHVATLFAMFIFFRNEIFSLLTTRRRMIGWILLGSVPAALVGFTCKDAFEAMGGYPAVVAGAMVVNGIFLIASNYFGVETRRMQDMTAGDSLLIGLAQAVAITPGISRSGSTITAGLMCGLQRQEAFAFSFLLGMPAIAGAAMLEGRKIQAAALGESWAGLLAGFIMAFVAGMAAIWVLSRMVKRRNLMPFGLYTIALAMAVFIYLAIK